MVFNKFSYQFFLSGRGGVTLQNPMQTINILYYWNEKMYSNLQQIQHLEILTEAR